MVRRHETTDSSWVILPVLLSTALVSMMWLRYGGRWAEVDTAVLTAAARATLNERTINPSVDVYLNGFSYPSFIVFLSTVTGLPIPTIQTGVAPACLVGTSIVMFIAFRAITASGRLAAICSCLLLVQPDFLFVNQRGSHEKMTWTLVMVLLFALVTSFRRRQFAYTTPLTVAFYLGGFALITTNAFFASSLITSFVLSFVGVTLVTKWLLREKSIRPLFRRLGYIFVTLSVLSYLYIVYVFPPVRTNLGNLQGVFDRVSALYLDVEASLDRPDPTSSEANTNEQPGPVGTVTTAVASPYNTVALAWTNTRTYFVLTSLTWILLGLAVISWTIGLFRYFRRGASQDRAPVLLMWVLAGATGIQILLSIVADAAGALGQNMQLRLFPAFALFVVPLVVTTVRLPSSQWSRPWFRNAVLAISMFAFAFFSIAGYLKATNDPIVSNKWIFYSDAEASMLRWADLQLSGNFVWSEFDERLAVSSDMVAGDSSSRSAGARWIGGVRATSATRFVIVSDITRKRATRLHGAIPDINQNDVIFDNGRVQIYHRVPDSPYVP